MTCCEYICLQESKPKFSIPAVKNCLKSFKGSDIRGGQLGHCYVLPLTLRQTKHPLRIFLTKFLPRQSQNILLKVA